jgi:hypothetical protein
MTIDMELIAEIKKKSELAESHVNHLKEVTKSSDFPDGLDIPSINELRYALNHVLRYLLGEQNGGHDALKHVHRAIFDCYETETFYLFAYFSDFEADSQDTPMKDVFPKYLDCARDFGDLRDFIKTTPRSSRHEYYAELEIKLGKVRPYIGEIRAVKQEVLKLRAAKEKERKDKDDSLRIANDSLRIANDQLELARRTVTIRTTALVIAAAVGLLAAAAAFFKH